MAQTTSREGHSGGAAADPSPGGRPDAHLAAAVDVCAEGILLLGADGHVLSWNRAAARILGPACRLAPGAVLTPAFADGADWLDLLERAGQGERISGVPVDLRRGANRRMPALVTLVPFRDADGDQAGCTVVVRDVSEQVFAQQTLAESERRVRRSEALARTGAFVVDGANRSVQWSDGMYAVYGVDPAEFEPSIESHLALIDPEDRGAVSAAFETALVGGSPTGVDHRILGAGRQWVSLALEPRPASNGSVLGLGGVCQDITARVLSEATLAEALEREQAVTEELRRVDALKDEFLATVSHELRTPLTSISGYAALLSRRAPEHAELVEPIERNAHEMHRLIQRLLDQARLESGRVTIVPANLPLADAARAVAAELAEAAGARVVVEVADDLNVTVDPDALAHILANLIGNAAKYAPGGVITVRTEPPGAEAMVTVAVVDDGPGIPPEYQEHLFDPFFRVPGAYRNAKGTGFGLAIVRRYVELHGGSVWCASEVGRGAAFCFTLPTGGSAP